ncbi:CRISPR-associated endonuclease Cas3'' [Streptomyces sp. NPDC057702]|uniref:CRISPR-associated endonuclease Cas3'' n=1 Tax=unclassified Streptomyces TaxID=2593676 RepID=UPI003699E677
MPDGPYRDAWDPAVSLGVCVAKTPRRGSDETMSLVATHLLDTAAVAERLWDDYLAPAARRQLDEAAGGPGRGRTLLAWICGLHDLGKVTPAFQCRLEGYPPSLHAAGLTWPSLVPRVPWRHGAAGGYLLIPLLREEGWPTEQIAWVWPLVAGHHGILHAAQELEPAPKGLGELQGGERWARARLTHLRYVTEQLGLPSVAAVAPVAVPSRALQLMVSGLVVMADWIASGTAEFPGIDDFARVGMAGARERAAAAWRSIGLRGGWGTLPTPPADAFERRFQHPPRPVQTLAMETARAMEAPGLLVVEGPTGEGKTWAGLMATEILASKFGADGVFVGMPEWSANDPLFAHVREWVGRVDPELAPHVALLHGQRNLMREWSALIAAPAERQRAAVGTCDEDGEPGAEGGGDVRAVPRQTPADWFFGYDRGLLCPFVVGPTSTLLHAATRTKFVMLRMAGLLGKVVLLDEVHAADVSGSRFLLEGLRWFGEAGVPVVLLSATLPPAHRQALADAYLAGAARREEPDHHALAHPDQQPAVTAVWPTPGGPASLTRTTTARRPSVPLSVEPMPETVPAAGAGPAAHARARAVSDAAVAGRLRAELADGGCALVIRDSADRAQSLYTRVRGHLPDTRVVLLHEQLTAAELATRMAECLDVLRPARPGETTPPPRPHRMVVIASQVAEQSCDLDADLLLTDLAPLDLLLQRVGRLHRGDHAPRPERLRTPRVIVTGYADGDAPAPEAAAPAAPPATAGPTPPGGPGAHVPVPRFPAAAEDRYGRHALLLAAAHVRRAARPEHAWSHPADVPGLVAAAYDDTDETGHLADVVPGSWRETVAVARRAAEEERRSRAVVADERVLSRRGARETATLEGLHRLTQRFSGGPDDLDAVVQDHAGERAALLTKDGDVLRTVDGTEFGENERPDAALCAAVTAATVGLPPSCHGAGRRDLPTRRPWGWTPLAHTRVLILCSDGRATLAGRTLRYDPELGLVDEGPAT